MPGNGSAGCGQQDAVEHGEPGTADLAAQHPKLLPEHQNLQVLRAITGAREDQQANERSDQQPEHERHQPMLRSPCSRHESEIPRPTGHLEQVLRVYVQHYNQHRPHRALSLHAPDTPAEPILVGQDRQGTVHRRDLLGGLVHEYRRAP
jgi:hypothetical protein